MSHKTRIKIEIVEVFDDHDGDRVAQFFSQEGEYYLGFEDDISQRADFREFLSDVVAQVKKWLSKEGIFIRDRTSVGVCFPDRETAEFNLDRDKIT